MYTGRRTGVASPVGHRRYTHVRDRETSHRRSRAELDDGGRDSSDPTLTGEKAHSTREVGDTRTETCRVATLSPSDPTRDEIDLGEAS